MWCLVLTSPCCCGPCETRITTGAKVVMRDFDRDDCLQGCAYIWCPITDCLYLQHCAVELPSCLLHTTPHVGENTFEKNLLLRKVLKPRCMSPFSVGSWPAQISARWLVSGNSQVSSQVGLNIPFLISFEWMLILRQKAECNRKNRITLFTVF